ncbi:MAG: hypothetical protein RRB13_06160 [bacterium]|nr:hypothetical protein [bacterium]
MQTSTEIEQLGLLMGDIAEGRVSRNKNFYTLARAKEYNRFKRAKLLLSLVEDLERTCEVPGNRIGADIIEDSVEVFLYNPSLCYNRRVMLSRAELDLIRRKTKIAFN